MGINVKTWAPLGVAIVLGGFAAKAGYSLMSRKPPEKVVVQKVTRVAVAKDDIAAGTELTVADVAVNNVPEAAASTGTFDSADRLAKRVTTVAIKKGQPIFETMLAPENSGSGLTAVVPEGMRAVTMEINEVSGVAGLIVPGCRVDVVSTFPNENGQMMTKTVCQALKIVAVGRKYTDSKVNAGQPAPAGANGEEAPMFRSVTLLVTAHEAEVLDLAAHTGSPRLVLRSSRDTKDDLQTGMSEGVTVAELRGSKPTATPTAVPNSFSNFFTDLVKQLASRSPTQIADDRKLTDPAGLFGQPATQPSRQVTIIRNTREQSVQMNIEREPHGTVIANTDTSSEIQK